jgi:hypothetical protein
VQDVKFGLTNSQEEPQGFHNQYVRSQWLKVLGEDPPAGGLRADKNAGFWEEYGVSGRLIRVML